MGRGFSDQLGWIDAQGPRLARLVADWASVNSGSYHVEGVERCTDLVLQSFAPLGGELLRIELAPHEVMDGSGAINRRPLARAARIVKRPDAPHRVLLAIHVDTVYGPDDPFQMGSVRQDGAMTGPGVLDAKGGLAVMLAALEALERSPVASGIGWTVILNPDEELGSPGSTPLFESAAKEHSFGLLFEPAMQDGALVSARKGSGNFSAVVTGRSAHAGRDPHLGRNAIHALGELIVKLAALNGASAGVTVNVGRVEGGGAVNVVPDRAACRFNVRVSNQEEQRLVEQRLATLTAEFNGREGYGLTIHGSFTAPPKPSNPDLMKLVSDCGRELGMQLHWRPSGGTCDGNRLSAAGLPNVDSLGPRGGGMHSPGEFLITESLTERAKLTALLLMKLAAGEVEWPSKPKGGH